MDLKECSHCGGEGRVSVIGQVDGVNYKAIVCRKCGCKTDGYRNVEKAAEIWNSRYDASPAEKELDRIIKELESIPTRSISIWKAMRIVKGKEQ